MPATMEGERVTDALRAPEGVQSFEPDSLSLLAFVSAAFAVREGRSWFQDRSAARFFASAVILLRSRLRFLMKGDLW